MAVSLKRALLRVTIMPKGNMGGHCRRPPIPDVMGRLTSGRGTRRDRGLADSEILIALAGGLAVQKETGVALEVSSYADIDKARDWAEALCGGNFDDANAYATMLMDRLQDFLRSGTFVWRHMVTLRDELLVHKTVSGRGVRAHLDRVAVGADYRAEAIATLVLA
jgi:hypothetical protein